MSPLELCGTNPTLTCMPVDEVWYEEKIMRVADNKGRVTLGQEYSREKVEVFARKVPDVPSGDSHTEVLSKMSHWAAENEIQGILSYMPKEGKIETEDGVVDTPYRSDK